MEDERAEKCKALSEAEDDLERINREADKKMTIRFTAEEIREIQHYINWRGIRERKLKNLHHLADQLVEYFFGEGKNKDLIKEIQDKAAKQHTMLLREPIQIKTHMLFMDKERTIASELIDEHVENLGGEGWNYFVDRFVERLEEEIKKKNMGFENERRFRSLLHSVRVEVGTKSGGYEYVLFQGEGHKRKIAPGVPSAPALTETISKKLLVSQKGAIEDAIARGESDVDVKKLLNLPYDEELNKAIVEDAKTTEQEIAVPRKKKKLEQVEKEILDITQALGAIKDTVSHAESIKRWFESEAEFYAQKAEAEALQREANEQDGILSGFAKTRTSRAAGFFGKQVDRFDPGIYTSPLAAGTIEKISILKARLQTAKQSRDSALAQCEKIGKEELGLEEGKVPSGTMEEAIAQYKKLVEEEKALQTRLAEANRLKGEYQQGRSLFGKKSADEA